MIKTWYELRYNSLYAYLGFVDSKPSKDLENLTETESIACAKLESKLSGYRVTLIKRTEEEIEFK